MYTPTTSSVILTTDTYSDILYTPVTAFTPMSPITTSINLTYSKPLVGYYNSSNDDPLVQEKITKHIYYKLLDKWLFNELDDIVGYFTVKDGKVEMIKDLSSYKEVTHDAANVVEKKADYIEKHVFTKFDMYEFLLKYSRETDTNWVDLPLEKTEYFLRQALREKLLKIIKRKISKKNGKQDGGRLSGGRLSNGKLYGGNQSHNSLFEELGLNTITSATESHL